MDEKGEEVVEEGFFCAIHAQTKSARELPAHITAGNHKCSKIMGFVWIYSFLPGLQLVLSVGMEDTPTLGRDSPRLLSLGTVRVGFEHPNNQKHSVFYFDEDSGEMFVGVNDLLIKLDRDDHHVIEKYHLNATGQQSCEKTSTCENVITAIEKFEGSLFICGTNGQKPQCWKLVSSTNNQSHQIVESYDGKGISPPMYTQNSLTLTVEGDLYAAAPMDVDRSSLQFRRKAGSRSNLWMNEKLVLEPTFISASWVKREEDPDNDKIYIFLREKNSDPSPEADPWISRVARVCKVDEGGSKRLLQNRWTSFLKARLVCGYPEESLYFNHLQDIYIMHNKDWHNTRVYALFSSSWNSTAVCIYTVQMIENIFENSTFKGYDQDIPKPRPGTCVKDSKRLPLATVNIVMDYPEMTDWVHSIHSKAPFYVSSNNYTKIAVDQVLGADQCMYNVLLLATDSGKIHKVLESGSEPFIISEAQVSNSSAIQSMKLDSKKKKLVVGFSDKVSTVDLQMCKNYNNSCAECVLARDPYCAWTKFGCTPTVPGGIQNVMDGTTAVCSSSAEEQKIVNRSKREIEISSPGSLRTLHSVSLGVPLYLTCPIDSYHAVYTWEHGGQSSPCLQMQSNCLHLIPAMARDNYGIYECVSIERDYSKVVKQYRLAEQMSPETKKRENTEFKLNNASAVVSQIVLCLLGVAVAVLC
ncbi:semaphorin-7A [Solea senegalensis]|uniref:Semaphorin-7A n=1 Tax=Solea senegalensis TaxID=28829 RepID=A0AAV6T1M0_SOLSE|nr:semaphorin-7A [Solea senegalensis]KAG7523251.1 semaphorin-7A [Solea senegalensis]